VLNIFRDNEMPSEGQIAAPTRRDASHGARLLDAWKRLEHRPGGLWLFSRLVGRMAPYTGTLGARVVALHPGRAEVQLRDRRRVRNHLRSIHAIALANLGELASGLAMTAALPSRVRGIPVHLAVDYHKKARGTLTAVGTAEPGEVIDAAPADAVAEIRDRDDDVVAIVTVRWQLQRT
jgi:acyl-coenzyme A thioesterase PaaI-like protein